MPLNDISVFGRDIVLKTCPVFNFCLSASLRVEIPHDGCDAVDEQ